MTPVAKVTVQSSSLEHRNSSPGLRRSCQSVKISYFLAIFRTPRLLNRASYRLIDIPPASIGGPHISPKVPHLPILPIERPWALYEARRTPQMIVLGDSPANARKRRPRANLELYASVVHVLISARSSRLSRACKSSSVVAAAGI